MNARQRIETLTQRQYRQEQELDQARERQKRPVLRPASKPRPVTPTDLKRWKSKRVHVINADLIGIVEQAHLYADHAYAAGLKTVSTFPDSHSKATQAFNRELRLAGLAYGFTLTTINPDHAQDYC